MFLNSRLKLISCLGATVLATAVAIFLPSCGGGGGSSGDPSTEPAPQTLNALTITPASGFSMTFIRDSGNTLNGENEEGTVIVTMTADGDSGTGNVLDLDDDSNPITIEYTDDVYLVDYTYTRKSANAGSLRLEGSSSGDSGSYFETTPFDFTYNITFGTDGSTVTSIIFTDTTDPPRLRWLTASIQIFGGGDVPVGYSVQLSNNQDLPYLYPEDELSTVNELIIEVTSGGADTRQYAFTSSSPVTANLDGTNYTVEDSGAGQEEVNATPSANDNILYVYEVDQLTIDKAVLKIFDDGADTANDTPRRTYQLTFSDRQSGTFTNGGESGDFTFPLLDN
jgi:hypothetical protein